MQWLLGLLSGYGGPFAWIANLILNFFWGKAEEKYSANEKDKANQAAQAAQADQDTKKASELNPDSKAEDVSAAIDDELKHL